MRLFEIENINRSIIALKQLSESYKDEFKQLFADLQMSKKLKGTRLTNFVDSSIVPFRNKLTEFLNTKFYKDPDIDNIKSRLREMLKELK